MTWFWLVALNCNAAFLAALERTTAFDLQNEAQKAALYGLLGQFGMEIFAEF